MEKISGPVFGYYLACYTVESSDGHYGYAKAYTDKPDSAWGAQRAVCKVAAGPFRDPRSAIDGVISRSERKLARRIARVSSDWAMLEASMPRQSAPPSHLPVR